MTWSLTSSKNVLALLWLGRGDFDASEWSDALALAAENWSANTADYLLSLPLLAEYLSEGLHALDYDCE
ncbi:MAG: hypothetical protein ACI9Y1_001653 [Lentisphaeria bacterium]|jgi:hypothetical protein